MFLFAYISTCVCVCVFICLHIFAVCARACMCSSFWLYFAVRACVCMCVYVCVCPREPIRQEMFRQLQSKSTLSVLYFEEYTSPAEV